MLTETTVSKLREMRLSVMVKCYNKVVTEVANKI